MVNNKVQKQCQKLFTTEGTEYTEFYFVNSAVGAANNKKFSPCLPCPPW